MSAFDPKQTFQTLLGNHHARSSAHLRSNRLICGENDPTKETVTCLPTTASCSSDEMNFIAIRLEPARPAMWAPSLLAGGSVGERNGAREQILEGLLCPLYSIKKPCVTLQGFLLSGE
jgi:hypothetical protein